MLLAEEDDVSALLADTEEEDNDDVAVALAGVPDDVASAADAVAEGAGEGEAPRGGA